MNSKEFKTFIRTTVKRLIRENSSQDVNELARIATLIKLGDPEKVKEAKDKFKDTWIMKLINHLEENPDGDTQINLAQASGKTRQQDVNPIIKRLLDAEVFTKGNLKQEPKPKKNNSGVRGRPLIAADERKGEEVVKSIVKKIKFDEEPRQEYVDWFVNKFSQEDYDKLVALTDAYMSRKSDTPKEEKSKLLNNLHSFLTSLGFEVKKQGRPALGSNKPKSDSPDSDEKLPDDNPLE